MGLGCVCECGGGVSSQCILNFSFLGRESVLQSAFNSPAKDRDPPSEACKPLLPGCPVAWSLCR